MLLALNLSEEKRKTETRDQSYKDLRTTLKKVDAESNITRELEGSKASGDWPTPSRERERASYSVDDEE